MVSSLFPYQLVLLGLLWRCVTLHDAWPNDRTVGDQHPTTPAWPRQKGHPEHGMTQITPGTPRSFLQPQPKQYHRPKDLPPASDRAHFGVGDAIPLRVCNRDRDFDDFVAEAESF